MQVTWIQQVSVITVLMLVVGIFLIVLQYSLMFLLKEHVALTVTFSLTRDLTEICFPANILLILKELNARKTIL